ncbi:transposase [Variovorax guangxiensis]|uniref:Transposase n=1 Tax=Variovorax guangxiensis TaxID=1775474 RepID=A0A3S0ZFK3_9BURK|nr:transposase [Variovorax guangxiensis]
MAACAEPGVTVAAAARAFGLNDNLVHDWRRGCSGAGVSKPIGTSLQESSPEFVALSLPSSQPPQHRRLLPRGSVSNSSVGLLA